MPVILGLGELLWDDFPDGRRPGGAAANFAYHAGLLDADVGVISRVGDDQDGRDLIAEIELAEVDPVLVQTDPIHPTGVSSIELDEGQPSYMIHPAAWDHIEVTTDTIDTVAGADAICFGTLAQRHADSRAAIQAYVKAAAEGGAVVVFDVNLRQDYYDADVLRESLKYATIVKLNDGEVTIVGELLGLPTEPSAFAAALKSEFDVQTVCITRGADGCLLFEGDETVDVSGTEIELVDAVGAGDAFTAALVVSTLEGFPLEARGEIANAVGALVASSAGAMPDIRPGTRSHVRRRRGRGLNRSMSFVLSNASTRSTCRRHAHGRRSTGIGVPGT